MVETAKCMEACAVNFRNIRFFILSVRVLQFFVIKSFVASVQGPLSQENEISTKFESTDP